MRDVRDVPRCEGEDLRGRDLRARVETACSRASFEFERATSAALASRTERLNSAEIRRRSRLQQGNSRAHRQYFRLDGQVDGGPVFAVLRDADLIAHDALLERARVVVALGEIFSRDGGQDISASLDGPPIAIMLTLIRACDAAPAIVLGPSTHPGLRLG